MENLQTFVHMMLAAIVQLGLAAAGVLTELEIWLRGELRQLGVPQPMQSAVLVGVAVVLVLGALRLFGGLIRILLVLVVLLIVVHIVLPISRG